MHVRLRSWPDQDVDHLGVVSGNHRVCIAYEFTAVPDNGSCSQRS
jgi:hypothetical protein